MYSFRESCESDYDFLYSLNVATTKEYVSKIWGWDDQFQRSYFRSKFHPSKYKIITFDNEDIGALSLEQQDSKWYINKIQIIPTYQYKGIGTKIIQDILQSAQGNDSVVSLKILKVNPAQNLYKRLGFSFIGETPTHYLMNTRF